MRAIATALLGVAVATAPALAQKAPEYDPTAEVTVTGRVVGIHESKAEDDHPGLHFALEIAPAPGDEPAVAEGVVPAAPVAGETATGEPEAAAAPEPAAGMEPGAPAAPEPPVAEANTVEVHACPMDLLGYLDFLIEEGDELTITGSRPAAGPIIIAREIVKGTVKLQVRDAEGVPIWEDLP